MYASRRAAWDFFAALCFIVSVCFVCWALSFAAAFGPNFTINIRPLQFSFETKFALLTAATLIPALYCLIAYQEPRTSLKRVVANWRVYLTAVVLGLALPFLAYPGTHYYDFPWGSDVAVHLGKVLALNVFLAPLWEEIVWRGCFLKRIRSFFPAPTAILLMSFGWTVWHGGYIAFLYSGGIPVEVLRVLPFTYFCAGIILGSVFELGGGSIWPCVLMHSALNSATLIYYTPHNRASEMSSYVSELSFATIVAASFFWIVVRRQRASAVEI